MEFVHRPYIQGNTIAAIATPPGEGGVAIIRVSGSQALDVVSKIYTGPLFSYKTHTAHLGKICSLQGEILDEVLILVMLGSRSFTGEDTVEIHCHGGSIVTRKILEEVLLAGARAALPGEFSLKAFMNGKIDLAQAEAIQELISARNDSSYAAAKQQLEGRLSGTIKKFQKELTEIAAILEAWVDFPEEGLEFASEEEILASLQNVLQEMSALSSSFSEGRILREGLSLCLMGCPNAGKSSLMNALLGKDRSIVTEIAGTTRDLVEDDMTLGGLHFRITDTAGIRETDEVVEKEGIIRSKRAMEEADLVLWIHDASCGEDLEAFILPPLEKTIFVQNKIDKPHRLAEHPFSYSVALSAKTGQGVDALKEMIHKVVWKKGPPSKEEIVITNARHKQALDAAISACKVLIDGIRSGVSPEFLAADMRKMLFELASIVGGNITEDVLSAIFSKFCVGK